MKKDINLYSLVNAKRDLSPEVFKNYVNKIGISIKESELEDLNCLIDKILKEDVIATRRGRIFNSFYVGYSIKQIGKEFDLLRIGENYIINIELKRIDTGERILEQLTKNKYYLNSLGKEILNFTYVVEEEKLYFLKDDNSITIEDINFLIKKLNDQTLMDIKDINELFEPTKYLVSPFNSTDRFLDNEYFLTNHQKEIKAEVIKISTTKPGPNFISIQGSAGTGKTLLVYDIVKEYISNKKKVVIIHCGTLNNGHNNLIYNSWDLISIRDYKNILTEMYDLIVIDEVQRIRKHQLENIIDYATKANITCIFSYDPLQCLHDAEINSDIPTYLDTLSPTKFQLSEKIRTNQELTSFIRNFFDLSDSPKRKQYYSNIDVHYFSNLNTAKSYINGLRLNGWTTINYTESKFKYSTIDDIRIRAEFNAHSVIGQEFDNVVGIIGPTFFYNSKGKLAGPNDSYYHPTKMLFQILTRTRKKLTLVIINNENILKECMEILR